jgi:divalent metal cation (Fe/Co/Zn/Cd) transporter
VALLADTIHNFSDALTAVPLWVAFVLSRRAATRRYTYGYGRVEDLAGLFIVTMIALSAVLAWYESIRQPTTTDLLPTSMATIGIMPIVCIRTPNSSPPAKPPTTPLTNRPTIASRTR